MFADLAPPERHEDSRIDDRFTYYETDAPESDDERFEEDGLWHSFGFGNRQKRRPRYE